MLIVAEIFVYAYCLLVAIFIVIWLKLSFGKSTYTSKTIQEKNWLSVVVVCRNEMQNLPNLLKDLENQTLPKIFWEAIFVDDASEDGSYEWLLAQVAKVNFRLKVLQNPASSNIVSPKKRGITEAIKQAEGTWIACTDADCSLPTTWLQEIYEASQNPEIAFISMPVRFSPVLTWFEQWQAVEFASLIGSGAACIALGVPTMCNGANIAYRKKIFEEVGGFSGSEHIASGDDEFLMHKIAKKSSASIQFLKSQKVIVSTTANATWKGLFSQRLRWASKWENYQSVFAKILAVFIFLVNVSTIFLYIYQDFSAIIFKFSVEFILLGLVLIFLEQKLLSFWIPFVFLVYPFYVVFFALFARKQQFTWKERHYNMN
ncbi:MAG: glycosyltransferase [Raineya sp.]